MPEKIRARDAPRRRAAACRALGPACLLLLFLTGRLAHALHLVLVEHSVCAAHGELIEHATDDAAHRVPAVAERSEGDARGPIWSRASGADASHDHCWLAVLQREQPRIDLDGRAQRFDGRAKPSRTAPLGAPIVSSIPRFRLAPKQSPPAAA